MRRTVSLMLALCAALASTAAAQPARVASPGKYRFSGTVAASAEVSGWFEVDIDGLGWLSDGSCTPTRQATSGSCTVWSVKIRRVRSVYLLDVLVEVLMASPGERGGFGSPANMLRVNGTLSARRV